MKKYLVVEMYDFCGTTPIAVFDTKEQASKYIEDTHEKHGLNRSICKKCEKADCKIMAGDYPLCYIQADDGVGCANDKDYQIYTANYYTIMEVEYYGQ